GGEQLVNVPPLRPGCPVGGEDERTPRERLRQRGEQLDAEPIRRPGRLQRRACLLFQQRVFVRRNPRSSRQRFLETRIERRSERREQLPQPNPRPLRVVIVRIGEDRQ